MGGDWTFPKNKTTGIILVNGCSDTDPAYKMAVTNMQELTILFGEELGYPTEHIKRLSVTGKKTQYYDHFIEKLKIIIDAYSQIIFYYTGHGFPHGMKMQFPKEPGNGKYVRLKQLLGDVNKSTKNGALLIMECCSLSDETIYECQSSNIGIIVSRDGANEQAHTAFAGGFRTAFCNHLKNQSDRKFVYKCSTRSESIEYMYFGEKKNGYKFDISGIPPVKKEGETLFPGVGCKTCQKKGAELLDDEKEEKEEKYSEYDIKINELSLDVDGWCKTSGRSKWKIYESLSNGRLLLSKVGGKYDGYYFGFTSFHDCVGVCNSGRKDISRYVVLDKHNIPIQITSKAGGTYYGFEKKNGEYYLGKEGYIGKEREIIIIQNLSLDCDGWCKTSGTSRWVVADKMSNGRVLLQMFGGPFNGKFDGYYLGFTSFHDCVGVCNSNRKDISRYVVLDQKNCPTEITSKPGGTYYKMYEKNNYWYLGNETKTKHRLGESDELSL